MNIVFRTDASINMGTGHVMRCLTLAEALRQAGHDCHFICREHEGNLLAVIQQRGFTAWALPMTAESDNTLAHSPWLGATQVEDVEQCLAWFVDNSSLTVDWLIVDHYGLDKTWVQRLRPYAKRLMVIDDLADREHDCDVLLDQNLGREHSDYNGLVPTYCQRLIGPQYALLRPEFAELREYSLQRRQANPQLKKLLISLGGVDKDNITGQVLTALENATLPQDIEITVVMGATAPHLDDVQAKAEQLPWQTEVVVNVADMAQRMADADLAIGAAGSTSWERCCLGLPTVMLVLADNQREIAQFLQKTGCAKVVTVNEVCHAIQCLDSGTILDMAQKATTLVNANGATVVQQHLIAHCDTTTLRPIEEKDLEQVLALRNLPEVRYFMFNPKQIDLSSHKQWYVNSKEHAQKSTYVYETEAGSIIGSVNLNFSKNGKKVEWGFYASPNAPKGTGTRMLNEILRILHIDYKATIVNAKAIDFNEISKKLHLKLGFDYIGTSEHPYERDGVLYDVHNYQFVFLGNE